MEALLPLAADPATWAALAALILMEVVLGIDNLIFIAILTNRLPEHQRALGRRIGIGLALILRLVLLGSIAFIVTLTKPIFSVLGQEFGSSSLRIFSRRSSISSGLFLIHPGEFVARLAHHMQHLVELGWIASVSRCSAR
jgi:predicted tellurium resistance membrane protein TerC